MFSAALKSGAAAAAAPSTDPDFEYVTMLLHGDGTNGGQNNTFLDSSTNNFTITRAGNTTQGSFSPYGTLWSNYFDGNGDYLRLSAAVNLSGDFTAEAFVYSDSTFSGQNQIFGSDLSTADGNKQLYIATSTYKLTIYDGSSAYASSGSVPQNQWSHVAISRQGSTLTFYINGVASGTATVSATMSFRIVGGLVAGASTAEQFKGYISNARIVSGTSIYNGNFTPSTTPLTAVSGTQLLTCQSNRFRDASTNNFAITVFGNTSVQRFSPFAPTAEYSTATIGGSGYFDGTGDYLSAGNNNAFSFGTDSYTVEAWIYYSNVGAIVCCNDTMGGFGLGTESGLCTFQRNVGYILVSSATPPINAWSHVVAVRSGTGANQASLYLNGVRISNGSDNTNWSINGPFLVGGTVSGAGMINGYVANLRVVKGSAVYDPSQTTITVPTAPISAITNTQLLLNTTNAAIFDNAMMNDLETVGNAQISTSVVKFGTGSLAFDGSGDSLKGIDNSPNFQFGTGDFTIEMWVYTANLSAFQTLLDTRPSDTQSAYGVFINNSAFPYWYDASGLSTSSVAVSSNTWTHVAVSRASGTLRVFVNGTSGFSGSNTNAQNPTGNMVVGMNISGSAPYSGYIDDLRITKGFARYTANFTPPTAAFPNN
jgi:hypothetical protein